jgi:hypothetical protein
MSSKSDILRQRVVMMREGNYLDMVIGRRRKALEKKRKAERQNKRRARHGRNS